MQVKEFLSNALNEKGADSNKVTRIINGVIIGLILLSSAAILFEISYLKSSYALVFDGIEFFTTLFFSI